MLLGLDLGTGSLKALLLEEGAVVAEASEPYPVTSSRPGWAETQPEAWWQAAVAAVDRLEPRHKRGVRAVGLSGQMHSVVLCRKGGAPLRPAILWADTRSAAQLEPYRQLSESERRRLANPITTGMTGPSLLWLRDHEPTSYETASWALQAKDWLRLRLTGEVSAEPSDASATLLYDLEQDTWAQDVLHALGLRPDLLAPLTGSGQVVGTLRAQAANALGLLPGTPVVAGGGDAACSALGSGLVRTGQVQANIGTGMQIFAVRAEPTADPHLRTHLYRTVSGGYYAVAAMQNAGLALEWVRGLFGLSWDEMYAEAFAVEPGCEGLSFLPYLTGERTPHLDPGARGAWHGLSLRHGRGHLVRSALEGVAFALKDGLMALRDAGVDLQRLRLSGGGTLRAEWRQLLANVLEQPLYTVSAPSASARGAALLAGAALGDWRLDDDLFPTSSLSAEPEDPGALGAAYERFRARYISST